MFTQKLSKLLIAFLFWLQIQAPVTEVKQSTSEIKQFGDVKNIVDSNSDLLNIIKSPISRKLQKINENPDPSVKPVVTFLLFPKLVR